MCVFEASVALSSKIADDEIAEESAREAEESAKIADENSGV